MLRPAPPVPMSKDEHPKPLSHNRDNQDYNDTNRKTKSPAKDKSNDTIVSSSLAPPTTISSSVTTMLLLTTTTFAAPVSSLQPVFHPRTLEIPCEDSASTSAHDPPPSSSSSSNNNSNNNTHHWGLLIAACILSVTAMAMVIVAWQMGHQWWYDKQQRPQQHQ